jgi:uncharacterized protein (DUF362 family)
VTKQGENKHDEDVLQDGKSLSGRISRRRFLEIAGTAAAGLLIASCTPSSDTTQPQTAPTEAAPTEAPTAVPPTATEAAPTIAPTATPQPTVAPTGLSSQVAIAKADDYDRDRIYNAVRDMLDDLGGLDDVVSSGDRVAIKTNLTGGLGNEGPAGFSPMESFVTHPEVVRALGALVRDAGAKEVLIVEAVYQWGSYVEWGYEEIAEDIGATLIDLNATDPYDEFVDAEVPGGGAIYETYVFNPLLQEVDVFMSAAKMKCHNTAGVTHSLKNLFGLVPARFYRLSEQHSHRSEFHGPSSETAGTRVPRIIIELNKTRPVDFALIDGVLTTEGGEGPWLKDFAPIAPGVLFAGKDPVATDAVATAAQGFDPTAAAFTKPFIRSENHLNLAVEAGLGTNRLDEIEVFGPSINEVKVDFKISYS